MSRVLAALLLTLAAVAALPVAAASASAAPSAATSARATLLDGRPVRPGLRADFIGVQWRGARDGAAIRLLRAGDWGPWLALEAAELHPRRSNASELVAARGAGAYQVRLPRGASDGRATAIDATTAAARAPLARPGRACFVSRSQWGADESLRFDAAGNEIWPPAYFPLQKLTLHHTVSEGSGPDAGAVVRAIYRWHAVELGFGDIGYHLLVDDRGCIYEGRHSGTDRVPVYGFAAADGTPRAVNAGHTAGYNAGNVGVALLGDFTDHAPTLAARRGAVQALAAVARTSRLDPLGFGTYVNPINGLSKDIDTISGHRDWLATECPGEQLYPLLPQIRHQVAATLQGPHATHLP